MALKLTDDRAWRVAVTLRPVAVPLSLRGDPACPPPLVDIVLPVHNEEADLERSVRRLHRYLLSTLPFRFRITIADNASRDRTWEIARHLEQELEAVAAVHLDGSGRGRALRYVWSRSDADVLAYMDIDLSTDLDGLLPLLAPLVSGHSDLAIGTRIGRGARVVRGPRRELISRCYNVLLRAVLQVRFSDAQCGFKAIRSEVAGRLLPLVRDDAWFFDTELLVLAERADLRIHEVAVDWIDDADSRVRIVPTALADLRGVARLRWALLAGTLPLRRLGLEIGRGSLAAAAPTISLRRQVLGFLAVGAASTIAYSLLYLALRQLLAPQLANGLSLLATAIANTAANRRLSFGVRGRRRAGVHQLQGLVVFGIGLAFTSGSLALLETGSPTRLEEVVVLAAANVAATIVRFVLFRCWVFRSSPGLEVAERHGGGSR